MGLALIAVLIGAECVRALNHQGTIAGISSSAALVPAELDPAFSQKLAERVRGPYERSHQIY